MGHDYYFCNSRWTNGPPSNTPKTEEEALSRIDELYASGIPFFSKETLRSARDQMQRPLTDGDKIYLKDLDGSTIEYELRIGYVEAEGPGTERVFQAPFVKYECRASMRHNMFRRGFDAASPLLCPISIIHSCLVREKGSHEPTGPPRLPQEIVATNFELYRAAWLQTEMCARLTRILDSAAGHLDIRKVVAVSLGELGFGYGSKGKRARICRRRAYQHAMTISLRDWVKRLRDKDVPCYVQDPEYAVGDKIILEKHAVEIIDDPVAWLEMDDFSVVVSIASNVPSREIIADVCRPAVVVWDRVCDEDYDQRGGDSFTDPCSPRVRQMMEGYDCYDFGASDEHFGDVLIYVRRPKTLCREE